MLDFKYSCKVKLSGNKNYVLSTFGVGIRK